MGALGHCVLCRPTRRCRLFAWDMAMEAARADIERPVNKLGGHCGGRRMPRSVCEGCPAEAENDKIGGIK